MSIYVQYLEMYKQQRLDEAMPSLIGSAPAPVVEKLEQMILRVETL